VFSTPGRVIGKFVGGIAGDPSFNVFPYAHFFAFSPSSTSRRMASGRVKSGSFCLAIQVSKLESGASNKRTPINVPLPVVTGRPRLFFVIT
jgi:hypothetical protein